MLCPSCGTESPTGFRFCGNCGAALTEEPAREVRKVVTIVFCDLTGSTELGDRTDPEALRTTMRGYYEEMRTILERHGGTVEKFIGDAVMAVFGVPVSFEDDALRAVRAAWEMRAAVPTLGLQARIGVNTGAVVTGEGDSLVTGDAVNIAARLEQAAGPGDVLIGPETQRLVRDAVRVEPVSVQAKGKSAPLAAHRLLEVDLEAEAIARSFGTTLVGRSFELDQLHQAFGRAVREQRCHLFTLLGPAGVGKSRLINELLDQVDATVVTGRCLDYGEGITFWPVISVLKQLGPGAAPTLDRLVSGASSANELFWIVRTELEKIAAERPLVVVFDDIQWGEETFLDLIDHIADLSRGAPIFLLCLARPELLDKRPGWGGGKLNATTLLLEPLTAEECAQLIDAHGGTDDNTRTHILGSAGGNPLFVEEMLALVRDGGDVGVPSSVHALLQARLDQLARDERAVIERGAVEGEVFHRGAVLELTRTADVEPQLVRLVRKEMIREVATVLTGDHAFRFRHLLIRDAAYDALPKETRADLHERFADWLEEHGADLIELDEVLGYHLEQAARYRRELGRADVALERRAALRLGEAGSKASVRSDAHGAANLLERALALLPADDPQRAPLLIELIGALDGVASSQEQFARIDELIASEDPTARMYGQVARLQLLLLTDPAGVVAEAEEISNQALELFGRTGDDLGLAQAHFLVAWINWLQSRAGPTAVAYQHVLEHARKVNARALVGRATIQQTGALVHGPFTVDEVRERVEQIRDNGSALARIAVLSVESELEARNGHFDEAIEMIEEASVLHRELGGGLGSAIAVQQRAALLRSAQRLDEAEAAFRDTLDRLEELGYTSFRSTTLINLAEVLYARGHVDEAERLVHEGQELGAAEDVVNFASGGGLLAKIAADRGEYERAEALGRDALEYAYKTDFPSVHAEEHEALAHVLTAAGRRHDAAVELQQALELWERHGYLVRAERVRELVVQL